MEDPTEDPDDERIELTPGQEETLRQAAENIRQCAQSEGQVASLQDSPVHAHEHRGHLSDR
jgi:hypothetical protein